MVDCAAPAQAAVGIGRWDVGLVRGHGRREDAVDAAVLLGVRQGDGLGIVVLRVVLLLWRLRGVAVGAVVAAGRGRRRALAQLRGAVVADEELVVLARGHAVAPRRLEIAVSCGSSVGVVAGINAWRPAVVRVLVLLARRAARVRYVGVVVILAVSVVRHGGVWAWSGLGRRDGWWCGRRRHSRGYVIWSRGQHDNGSCAELSLECMQLRPRKGRGRRKDALRLLATDALECAVLGRLGIELPRVGSAASACGGSCSSGSSNVFWVPVARELGRWEGGCSRFRRSW